MKKKFVCAAMAMALSMSMMGQDKAVQSFLSYTLYDIPGKSPFIENAMAFDCGSVVYKQTEPGKFKATVEITTIFRQGDKVCNFSKVALDSPVVSDTAGIKGAFIDQQRFALENGEYSMEISIVDQNNLKKMPYKTEQTIVVDFPNDSPAVSDILLVDTYKKASKPSTCTKSGYDLVPRVYSYYGVNNPTMTFYAELYNSDKFYKDGGQYMLNYYIESYESSSKMKDFNFVKRVDVNNVNIVLNSIDLKQLPTGNYYLVVEMRDRTNKLMASNSTFFQRYNPGCEVNMEDLSSTRVLNTFAADINNLDTIREYIRCLDPRCSEAERDYAANLVKTSDLLTMQQFLYTFWSTRNPLNPKAAWEEYYRQVLRVNASYTTRTKKGYMTDRGYVYLKYGTPDKICEEPNEPGAYPYEIWQYYEVANQRNKRFVFMSKDIVTNDYHLIHSDVVGEINNYRWQMEIYSRNYGDGYNDNVVDQESNPDAWGTRAGDLYNNPR